MKTQKRTEKRFFAVVVVLMRDEVFELTAVVVV